MSSPYLQGMIQNEIDQINREAANLDYNEYNESLGKLVGIYLGGG